MCKMFSSKIKKRKVAIIIGASLLLMAVVAGISIPQLGSLISKLGLIAIFFLDIIVSVFIIEFYKSGKPSMALLSGILRLIYSAILGFAIIFLFRDDIIAFNKIWGIGLIVFGVHLISLGLLIESGKKWFVLLIKLLLLIAGVGYLIWYIGILIIPEPNSFVAMVEKIFIAPMVLGEVLYAIWVLILGLKDKV